MSEQWYCRFCGPNVEAEAGRIDDCFASMVCKSCRASAKPCQPQFVTAMQEEIAALRAERATLSNGLMIQTDQVEHSEKVIEELEKVAEHAAALFYNHELTETWDALEEALRSAGYLKEDGDE